MPEFLNTDAFWEVRTFPVPLCAPVTELLMEPDRSDFNMLPGAPSNCFDLTKSLVARLSPFPAICPPVAYGLVLLESGPSTATLFAVSNSFWLPKTPFFPRLDGCLLALPPNV